MHNYLTKEFQENQNIFREGTVDRRTAYILKEGRVEISMKADSQKIILSELKPVNLFGYSALMLKNRKRDTTAKALTYCKLVEIHYGDFHEDLKKSPKVISAVLTAIVDRLSDSTLQVHDVYEKIHKMGKAPDLFFSTVAILDLLSKHNQMELNYPYTVQAIENCLNASNAQVKKELSILTNLDLITVKQNENAEKVIYLKELEKGQTFSGKAHAILNAIKMYQKYH